MKRLLLPLLAALALPTGAQEKQIVQSQLPSLHKAITIATYKTQFECRNELDGPFTEEQKNSIFQKLDINPSIFLDPVVKLLSTEFEKSISEDCKTSTLSASQQISNISSNYELRFNSSYKESLIIPIDLFSKAAIVVSSHHCKQDKGIYKTSEEEFEAIGSEFKVKGIPLNYLASEKVMRAAWEIKDLYDSDCVNLKNQNEQANKLIIKYFGEQ